MPRVGLLQTGGSFVEKCLIKREKVMQVVRDSFIVVKFMKRGRFGGKFETLAS